MADRYRFAVADGSPDWSRGFVTYENFWERAVDKLRFHRGAGFQINDRPKESLVQVKEDLEKLLKNQKAHTVFRITSLKDGYDIKAEKIEVADPTNQILIGHLRMALGTPYQLGGASLAAMDCSGSTRWSHAFEGVELPHKASWQHDLFRNHKPGFIPITRAQIKPGDLIFHHADEHVSTYLDGQFGGRVIDAEPHSTGSPAGWPSSQLGTGLRIRPMISGYYCDWENVCGIGRVVKINGTP